MSLTNVENKIRIYLQPLSWKNCFVSALPSSLSLSLCRWCIYEKKNERYELKDQTYVLYIGILPSRMHLVAITIHWCHSILGISTPKLMEHLTFQVQNVHATIKELIKAFNKKLLQSQNWNVWLFGSDVDLGKFKPMMMIFYIDYAYNWYSFIYL